MNLLEHYIEKVISVKDVTKEWEEYVIEENPNDLMLEVKMLVNCCGRIKETIKWFRKSELEKIKEQGYYLD